MRCLWLVAFVAALTDCAVAQTGERPWSGLYLGTNYGVGGGKYLNRSNNAPAEGAVVSDGTINTASGFVGGVLAGYQYRFDNPFVFGLEADFQWSSLGAHYARVDLRNDYEWDLRKSRLLSFGTLRARLGTAFGPILPYVTVGPAYGRVSSFDEEGGDVQANGVFEPTTRGKAANWRWGYALGAGVDYAIDQRWRVRAEYLAIDLGAMRAVDHTGAVFPLKTRAQTMRVGLNYGLDGTVGPRAEAMAPVADFVGWTGFFLGANVGLGGDGVHIVYLEAGEGLRKMNSFGALGGLTFGYDRQIGSRIVIGGLIDAQMTSIAAYRKKLEPPPEPNEPGPIGANGLKYRIETLSSARARLGYAFGSFLPYVTGGIALGQIGFHQYDPADIVSTQQRKTRAQTGYVVGAGFSYALAPHWTFDADYLVYGLGIFRGVEVDLDAFKTGISFSTLRAGVSYRF